MQISTDTQNHVTIVSIGGQVDSTTAPTLDAHLQEILDAGRSRLILDLENASYVSSAGLRVMSLLCRAAREAEAGGDLRLACPPEAVVRALKISGFDQVFHIYDSVDEALAGF